VTSHESKQWHQNVIIVTVFFTATHLQSKHYQFLKNILDERRIIILINLDFWVQNLFHILHEGVGVCIKQLCCTPKHNDSLKEKPFFYCLSFKINLSFFLEYDCAWKNRQFRFWYLVEIFSKTNKLSQLFQREQLSVFLTKGKIQGFK